MPKKEITCRLCKETFVGYGHSLKEGYACDTCNQYIVLPNRMKGIHF
jgi:hypothetical protein